MQFESREAIVRPVTLDPDNDDLIRTVAVHVGRNHTISVRGELVLRGNPAMVQFLQAKAIGEDEIAFSYVPAVDHSRQRG